MMKYKLFFGEIEVGEVIEEGDHIPYLMGELSLSDSFISSSDPLVKKLLNYIDCSVLFNEQSDKWAIVSEKTSFRRPIWTPGFGSNNKVALRIK